ncbi:hypothetical protein [Cellulosimicrobium sp. SH8]|uniref:hypothetical protein n=1 Tax=Cellulosimicrobium sp. SH8 TaxID=2952936 RepID=UPI0021F290C9|nr:hypothetical protein [Cellulosimicrobium sp. SH8]
MDTPTGAAGEGEPIFLGWKVSDIPIEDVDWTESREHLARSMRKPGERDVQPEWATEAAFDPERLIQAPDPASRSGKSIRIIGRSPAANRVFVVILVPKDDVQHTGAWWGASAWEADSRDVRRYNRE